MSNPTLPPELLNIIIPLSIPSPSRASLRERSRTLASLSLVSRTWHAYAQPRLYTHHRLTDKQLRKVGTELKRPNGEAKCRKAAAQVEVVSLGRWVPEYGAGLKTALKELSQVKEAYLEGAKGWASLAAIAEFKQLEKLHLTRVYNFLPPPQGFPSLRQLSLCFGLDKGIDWALFQPRFLPQLCRLVLEPADWTFSQDPCFLSAFAGIAPQLDTLCLAGADEGQVDFSLLLRKAINLKHLYAHTTSSNLIDSLPSLPSALETLRLQSCAGSPEALSSMLTGSKEVPHSLASLKRLTLPKSKSNGWDFSTKESVVAQKKIEQWCVARGVEVVYQAKNGMELEDWEPEEVMVKMEEW